MFFKGFKLLSIYGNKVPSRSLTNKMAEDVMESDRMCVCMYGVTLKNSVISSGMLVLGLDSVWKQYPGM